MKKRLGKIASKTGGNAFKSNLFGELKLKKNLDRYAQYIPLNIVFHFLLQRYITRREALKRGTL